MRDILSAQRLCVASNDGDLDTELVRHARLALADTFGLGRVRRIEEGVNSLRKAVFIRG